MFSSVRYYLSESLDPESRSNLEYVLNQHGAQCVNSATSPECTHIISNSSVFEGWQSVGKNAVVVTEAWVTRSVLFKKQQNPQHYSTDPGMLFSGVCACASELQTGDIEILSAGITSLGGQWRSGLVKDVTHLFVLQSGSEKYEHAMEFRGHTGLKVIVPHWFDDSVKLGVRDLDTKPYEWPEPEVLKSQGKLKSQDTTKRNIQLDPEKEVLLKIAAWSPSSKIPTAPRTKVYGGRKILLSTTLELGGRRKAIEAGINRSDGHVVSYEANDGEGDLEEELNKVDDCDIYITKFRTGPAYYKAVRARKTIGTLQWMFHVQATGVLTRPLDQLLHYPIPPKPIENFASHEITITNYTGEARDYLKKLIAAMGAQFTPTMSPRNTVLIAADTNNGAKTERAHAWSIPIVNHTWLEDCFVQWRNLTIGTEKYLSHPPGYNFYSCLGRRGYSKAVEDLEELVKREAEEGEEEEEEALNVGGGMPPGTENSARDAKEVANAIEPDPMEVDEQPLVNGVARDDIEMRPMTPKSSPTRSARGNIVAASSSCRRGRETQHLEDRGDISDEGETAVSRSKRKSAVMSSRKKSGGVGDAGSVGQKSTKTDPSPSRIKTSKRTADDKEVVAEGNKDSTGGKRGSKKLSPRGRVRNSDTEENEAESEEELLKRRSTRKGKAKDDDRENDITTKKGESSKSPTKHSPVTPSRSQVSVVVPPLNLHQSSRTSRHANSATVSPAKSTLAKSESIHVSANEQAREIIRPTRVSGLSAPLSSPTSAAQRSSKRSAATKATQRLHDTIMPDVMLYQQEMKKSKSRKSLGPSSVPPEDSVASGKRRASAVHQDDEDEDEVVSTSRKGKEKAEEHSEDEVEKNVGRKGSRKGTKAYDDDSDPEEFSAPRKRKSGAKGAPDKEGTLELRDDTEVEGRQQKKRKLAGGSSGDRSGTPSTTASVRMLTTQVILSDNVNKALAKLGVKVASKPWDCTHLVVKQLVRTEKFLCAVAAGASIVTEKWAIDSAAAKKLLPEDQYILKDPAGEKKYGFLLKDALERARSRDGRLLDRQTFYVTPKVSLQTDPKMLKSLITACGGQYMTQTPTQRILDASEDRHVISCPDDASIWRPFAGNHPVYTHELLLTGILKQEIDWESEKFRVPGSL